MNKRKAEEFPAHPRMRRELNTIKKMVRLYCRDNHEGGVHPCARCQELLEYAELRLKNCPFQEGKTTCGNCRVHCYKPSKRQEIKEVMRYAGPRMIIHHPIMALAHLIDGRRKEPKS